MKSVRLQSYSVYLFLIFFLIASSLYLRWFTFSFSTLDWDEVTYIMMGEGIRQGKIPFVDLWDIKPIGLYLIYFIANSILGYSMETVRILTFLFTTLSSLLIFFIFHRFSIGLAFVLGTLFQLGFLFLPSGLSGNTEVFFIFFQLLGIYLILKKNPVLHFFGFFSIGFAFIIKYIIAFEILAISCIYLYLVWYRRKWTYRPIVYKILPLIGLPLPFLIVGISYGIMGYWDEYWNTIIITSSQYSEARTIYEKFNFLGIFFRSYSFLLPVLYLVLVVGLHLRRLSKFHLVNQWTIMGMGWFLAACIGATWTGYNYEHYLLTLIPGILLILGGLVVPISRRIKNKIQFSFNIVFILPILIIGHIESNTLKKGLANLPDTPKNISNDLREKSIQSLFIASGMHTPYVILNIFPPVAYPQPYNYQSHKFSEKIGLDVNRLMDDVVQSQVDAIQFCDLENDEFGKNLLERIRGDYTLYKQYFPNCFLYLHKNVK